MPTLTFRLIGETPLMTHNAAAMITLGSPPEDWPRSQKWIPPAATEAEAGVYRLPDGSCGIPTAAVRKAAITAARNIHIKVEGRRGEPAATEFVNSSLMPTADLFPILDANGQPVTTYLIDVRRVTLGKVSVLRARPRWEPPWIIPCSFAYLRLVPPEVVAMALSDAGLSVGLGEYRPEKKAGFYGRFRVTDFDITD